ncbi:MAG: DUF6249 domain-containing protein [Muribaculaceae bacterium]|nr:DUF6249 domain-containing protein [Muribaculaceae bacterium]
MKKFLLSLIMVVSLSTFYLSADTINATPKQSEKEALKSLLVAIDRDSVSLDALCDSLVKRMDTRLFKEREETPQQESNFSFELFSSEDEAYELAVALVCISAPFITLFLIVLVCLLISYKKRKSRYALIEKAIASNYQIPEYLINGNKSSFSAPAPTPTPNADINIKEKQGKAKMPYYPNIWNGAKSGTVLIAVGLGLLFAFGFNFVGGLCSILIFIGIARVIMNVLEYRNLKEYYTGEDIHDEQNRPGAVPPPFNNKDNNND